MGKSRWLMKFLQRITLLFRWISYLQHIPVCRIFVYRSQFSRPSPIKMSEIFWRPTSRGQNKDELFQQWAQKSYIAPERYKGVHLADRWVYIRFFEKSFNIHTKIINSTTGKGNLEEVTATLSSSKSSPYISETPYLSQRLLRSRNGLSDFDHNHILRWVFFIIYEL